MGTIRQLSTAQLEQIFGVPHRESLNPCARVATLYTRLAGNHRNHMGTHALVARGKLASVLCGGWLLWWLARGERLIWMLGIGILLMGMAFLLPELILSISQSLAWGLLLLAGSLWSYRLAALTDSQSSCTPVSRREKSASSDSRSLLLLP